MPSVPSLVPPDYVERRGYGEQAGYWRLRSGRAEERVAGLEEAIRDALEHFRHCRLAKARAVLDAALACPECGARSERECKGLEGGPSCAP